MMPDTVTSLLIAGFWVSVSSYTSVMEIPVDDEESEENEEERQSSWI